MRDYINNMDDAQFNEFQQLWELDNYEIPPAENREEFVEMVLNESRWRRFEQAGWAPEQYLYFMGYIK